MRLIPRKDVLTALEALPEGLEKAQIRGALNRLAKNNRQTPLARAQKCPAGDFSSSVGAEDEWKITYRLLEIENEELILEEVISVVAIKKRRTHHWATEFYPKGDCQ